MRLRTNSRLSKHLRVGGLVLLVTVLALTLSSNALSDSLPQEPPPPREIRLDAADNGQQIELGEGEVLVIGLESNPSTGYLWEVDGLPARGEEVLRQTGEFEFEPMSNLIGAPAMEIMRFEAVRPGKSALRLVHRRPWEDGVEPLETFSIHVEGVGPFTGDSGAANPAPGTVTVEPSAAPHRTAGDLTRQGLPSAFNWCDEGGCTAIRDQGYCGSCWAFSTVGPLESNILIRDGVAKDLAEQYLLSCNIDDWDCGGGWLAHDYHWWKYAYSEPGPGAVYEADFPYVARERRCGPPHPHHERIASWEYVDPSDPFAVPEIADVKQAIYDHGPVSASMCVNTAFQYYSGGVFLGPGCTQINHGVVLVGWDDNQGIWYLRNSWGTGWGENGYMRIGYGVSRIGFGAAYVVYSADCYTLSTNVTPAGTGTITADPPPDCYGDRYEEGTEVQLTANPDSGWHFTGWSGDASGSDNPTTVTMNSDKSVSAHFMCDGCVPQAFVPLVAKGQGSVSGWVTIVSEDFEGSFPGPWTVFDGEAGYGEYYWGERNCRPYEGVYSGWAVGSGANGSSLTCDSSYPNDAQSWMVYGPFSLVGATAADLQLKLWLNTETGDDYVCRAASINGTNYYGSCTTGTGNWMDRVLDLSSVPTLGNLMDQPQVWVALIFGSNDSINNPEGAYVDNIVLRKYVSVSGAAPPATASAEFVPQGAHIDDVPMMLVWGE